MAIPEARARYFMVELLTTGYRFLKALILTAIIIFGHSI